MYYKFKILKYDEVWFIKRIFRNFYVFGIYVFIEIILEILINFYWSIDIFDISLVLNKLLCCNCGLRKSVILKKLNYKGD